LPRKASGGALKEEYSTFRQIQGKSISGITLLQFLEVLAACPERLLEELFKGGIFNFSSDPRQVHFWDHFTSVSRLSGFLAFLRFEPGGSLVLLVLPRDTPRLTAQTPVYVQPVQKKCEPPPPTPGSSDYYIGPGLSEPPPRLTWLKNVFYLQPVQKKCEPPPRLTLKNLCLAAACA
jgi:hypothetical protein